MRLNVDHEFLPKRNTVRASRVMDHFGISFETGRHVIAADLDLPLQSGDVVCFTGDSGSGKSSLMRGVAAQLTDVVDIDQMELQPRTLVDGLSLPFEESLELLAACGLGEARLMLRTPAELSDGQRYRYRLAVALSRRPAWVLADEFTATLDRTLARVIALNVHRQARRHGTGFLLATTHEDMLEELAPDLHIRCRLGETPRVTDRARAGQDPRKKKASGFSTNCGSVPVPSPTGRTSLGGIIAVTTSGS